MVAAEVTRRTGGAQHKPASSRPRLRRNFAAPSNESVLPADRIAATDEKRSSLRLFLRVAEPHSGARLCEAQQSHAARKSIHRRPPRSPCERPPCEGRRGPSRRVCFAPCAELRNVLCAVGMLRPEDDDCMSVFPEDWLACGFCSGRERSSRRGEPECEVGKAGREDPCSRRGAPD